ncbi:EAL domain-containing protein [Permianibacter sp. IMCC34836]|uniref:EAL domain-containing protein n=1 Tax=Permianibacter fluminis TaxID=2738515 RepID=UPI00155292F6|nr:EAL domain-containing protein [Permianibacter fluminis]NQD35812.1 EAL domain-containing protein [Permianibacter fluminis]
MPLNAKRLNEALIQHANTWTVLAGLLLFLLVSAVALLMIVAMDISGTRSRHVETAEVVQILFGEAGSLLTTLNSQGAGNCTPDYLAGINRTLFEYRYIRDVGVFNADHQLVCTTGLGTLQSPYVFPPSEFVFTDRTTLYIDVPVFIGGGNIPATLVLRDQFDLVMDPYVTRQIYESVDAIWMSFASGPKLLQARDQRPEVIAALRASASQLQGFDSLLLRSWQGYEVLTPVGDSRVILHSRISSRELLQRNRFWLLGSLGLAFFIGLLTAIAVRLKLTLLSDIDHRIRYLCDETHLICHYQPIVSLADGRIVGCEVLMRLKDGPLLRHPDETLPAIQRNKLEWQLDRAVSSKALAELLPRLPAGLPFKIAMNFFAYDLKFEQIDALLRPQLAQSGRDDLKLCIEFTEYGISAELIEQIPKLKQAGYAIAVDDFGTGYSNLNLVKRIAPTYLKIDKSFVFEMEDASVKSNLLAEIVSIARACGAETIAEGIENPEQASKLKALGVQFGQGFYFGKPVPVDAFIRQLGDPNGRRPAT